MLRGQRLKYSVPGPTIDSFCQATGRHAILEVCDMGAPQSGYAERLM
jgi:hypothetical protein